MTSDRAVQGLPAGQVMAAAQCVQYQEGAVVSRELARQQGGTVTLFAFDAGQGLSEHTAPFDALVHVLEGEAEIQIDRRPHPLRGGDLLLMPAHHPHAVQARTPFKMLLVLLRTALMLMGLLWGAGPATAGETPAATSRPIPVILDTDIGDDIDDTWALGLLLRCPELDLKLVVGDYGRAPYRARLLAKFLQTAGRTDVAVGVGQDRDPRGDGAQAAWVKDYDLKSYPGTVHADGIGAMIDLILGSAEPVTLIAIGPVPNLAAALAREPRIAQRARFVGMHGSVRSGYNGQPPPDPEWNVKADAASCRAVFQAAWPMTITPLDTCGRVVLDGERYQRVYRSPDPIAAAIRENYGHWNVHQKGKPETVAQRSSTLFDTVAVYLACRQDFCRMETVSLRVTDDGFTRVDPAGKAVSAAMEWTHLDGFRDWLVKRLAGGVPAAGIRPASTAPVSAGGS